MDKICDLHTHSSFSDGTLTPTELVCEAVKAGISALALCDHNTIDGLPEFLVAARDRRIEVVSGAEFSVEYSGKELHLLALFVKPKYFSQITELMLDVKNRKEQSNLNLIHSLKKDGIILDYDKIKSGTPTGQVNRAHIAAQLTERGYTRSVDEAFQTLLSKSGGYYKEPQRLTAFEMIDFIVSINALPVLAHPFLNMSVDESEHFLPAAKAAGLAGMECEYSLYDARTTDLAKKTAIRHGLKFSGGSDFHGSVKPDIKLGIGKGNLRIPYEWYEDLKELNDTLN